MSISILLPAQPGDLLRLKDIDKFLLRAKSVRLRSIVFFDESVSVFVVLKHDSEPKTVFMDVSVVPGEGPGGPGGPKTEADVPIRPQDAAVIASFALAKNSVLFEGKSDMDDAFYSVWTYQIPIVYPKKKASNPQILISCYCRDFVVPAVEPHQPAPVEILPDLEAQHSTNLLAELNNPVLKLDVAENYSLPSTFIEPLEGRRTLPAPEKSFHNDASLHTSISVPVSVSLVIRLKSTKPAGRNNVLLATLNVESSEELAGLLSSEEPYYFSILSLDVSFRHGSMEELSAADYKLPVRMRVADALNLTYKLVNADFEREPQDSQASASSKALNIKLVLQVQRYDAGSGSFVNVSNEITTLWAPILDFSIMAPPINSSLRTSVGYSQVQAVGAAPARGVLRKLGLHSVYSVKSSSNSGQLVAGTNASSPAVHPGPKPPALSSSNVTVNLANNPASALSGLKLTFIGSFALRLGEVSSWKIQAINNSATALNLSIVVQDPLHWASTAAQRGAAPNASSSNVLGQKSGNNVLVVNKIHLLNEIAAMKPRSGGVVFLENDVRLGPLETNSVMETSIQLMGTARGIHNLDGIKVFDTTTGDGLDFGKLVQVFVT